MNDFVHLHVHSEYSLLDGLGRTADLAKEAARLGQPALALTDHGVMHGAIEFFRNCKKNSVKPIIGVEAYLTQHGRPMGGKDAQKDKARHHLLLLAQNMTGYKNLLKICSSAQLEGFYHKPRIDADFLAAHADGLICTTGCMAAEIPYLLNAEKREPQEAKALERLQWYLDVFGRERFYVELQEHNIPELSRINKTLFEWSKQHDLGLLVTNDVHYVNAGDAASHDTLLCVQTNSLVTQTNRMKMTDTGYYLKSRAELELAFRSLTDLPESAFTNSLKIADMCQVDLEDGSFHLPNLPAGKMPAGFTYQTFLRYLTEEGLKVRYGARADSPEVQARKEHELKIISNMGFDIYYLIVWDLCEYARKRNIWWNVRGSGAGSIVAYATGITLIDPLKNNLIFERFLNPGRISMPDFDLDYPDDQREELIRYTVDTYGKDHVAQIVSFGRMKARAAVRDVGRALDIPLSEVDAIAKQISAIPGKPVTIDDVLNPEHEFFAPDLKQQYETLPKIKELIDYARNLEGVARHSSVHAAAVIITDKPLSDYVPLMRATGNSVVTDSVTQFEFPICESIGLLKVDFLGLSTLTVMRKAAELIKERHGVSYVIENMAIDDQNWQPLDPKLGADHLKKAFALFASGNTTGVFQVEGTGMTNMLKEMRPYTFDHIVAAISLYRPGPMEYIPTYIKRMHGEEKVTFRHPKLEPILGETYSIIVYQEQIIRIASDLAGYTPGEADEIRKAVGKKIKAKIESHRAKFIDGCEKNTIPRATAEAIWDDIEYFARYGFNKCLVGETEIIDAQTGRLVTIESLYRGQAKIEQTVTCDTDTLKLTSGQVTNVLDNGIKPVYRLTTALGHEITATANHPFYTFEGWRQLDELNVGNLLAIPRVLPVEGTNSWPEYQVIVLGHLLGNGNLGYTHSVYYYTQDDSSLQDYCQAIEQFDNVSCSISWNKAHFVYAKRLKRTQELGVVTWAKPLGLLGKKARAKEIPAEVFSLNNQQIALLLGRMWTANGHLGHYIQDNYYFDPRYPTVSKRLAQQIQHLLLRLGIVSRVQRVKFHHTTKHDDGYYQVDILTLEHLVRFAQIVGAHLVIPEQQAICRGVYQLVYPANAENYDIVPLAIKKIVRQAKDETNMTWPKFHAETGMAQWEFYPADKRGKRGIRREVITKLADYFDNDALWRYAKSDIYWDEVVAIEYVGEKQTYDLTIADTHNFIANNILVHNSHAADYGMVTCQTAYLKANYPIEYMTALLTVERNNTEKVSQLLTECRAIGIKVLPPHVNYSRIDFVIDTLTEAEPVIRFGMSAIKNVGEGPIEAILTERDANGFFNNLEDLCKRVDLRQVNRRALEGLIKAGALDCFSDDRALLMAVIERMLNFSSSLHKAASAGQMSLFGGVVETASNKIESILDNPPPYDPVSRREILEWEKELVGTYLSEHPIEKNMRQLKAANVTMLNEITGQMHDRQITVAGVITVVKPHRSKKGDPMAFIEIEDMNLMREVVIFPRAYTSYASLLVEGNLVIIKGKVDAKDSRSPKILADSISMELPKVATQANVKPEPSRPAAPIKPPTQQVAESRPVYQAMPPMPDEFPPIDESAEENPFFNEPHFEESFAPEPPPAPVQPTTAAPKLNGHSSSYKPAPQNSNGHAETLFNDSQSMTMTAPVVEVKTPPPPVITPKVEPSTPSHRMTDSHPMTPPKVPPPSRLPGDMSSFLITVRVRQSEDKKWNKFRLKTIVNWLSEQPGPDRFRLHVIDGKTEDMVDFPHHTTTYSVKLIRDLIRLFEDEDAIKVDRI